MSSRRGTRAARGSAERLCEWPASQSLRIFVVVIVAVVCLFLWSSSEGAASSAPGVFCILRPLCPESLCTKKYAHSQAETGGFLGAGVEITLVDQYPLPVRVLDWPGIAEMAKGSYCLMGQRMA